MIKKVMVIGCSGSGKSVFSRSFADLTDLPLYHLDAIWWREDGSNVSREEFDLRLGEILEKDEWIIDGSYSRTMERRMAACDTVVFFDLPTSVCVEGVKARKGKPRPDMPWKDAGDSDDPEFMSFVLNYNETHRPQVLSLLDKYSDKNIVIFKSRDDSEAYLEKIKQ